MGLVRINLDDDTHRRLKVYATSRRHERLELAASELLKEALDRAGIRLGR